STGSPHSCGCATPTPFFRSRFVLVTRARASTRLRRVLRSFVTAGSEDHEASAIAAHSNRVSGTHRRSQAETPPRSASGATLPTRRRGGGHGLANQPLHLSFAGKRG